MAKVSAPLLSFGASGTIAGTQVYSTWRGVPYARRHVIPANPKSPDQTKTRLAFAWLVGVWKLADPRFQEPWNAFSAGRPFVGRNALVSKNNSALRTATDLTGLIFSPGAKGGLAVPAATFTGGSGTITIAPTAPALPTGWSIVEAVGCAIKGQDPQTAVLFTSYTGFDATASYSIALTVPAGAYECATWFKFMKPDGTFAYSPSFNGTATAT